MVGFLTAESLTRIKCKSFHVDNEYWFDYAPFLEQSFGKKWHQAMLQRHYISSGA